MENHVISPPAQSGVTSFRRVDESLEAVQSKINDWMVYSGATLCIRYHEAAMNQKQLKVID